MRLTYIMGALVLLATSTSAADAQAAKSALVDSANKQLVHNAKPAKSSGTIASARTSVFSPKSTSASTAKQARVVPVPHLTSQSSTQAAKTARVTSPTDSATKAAPPVQRAPKVGKNKPPAK